MVFSVVGRGSRSGTHSLARGAVTQVVDVFQALVKEMGLKPEKKKPPEESKSWLSRGKRTAS